MAVQEKKVTRPYRKNRDTAVQGKKLTRPYRKKADTAVLEKADTAVTQLYSNKYLIAYLSCTFKCPVMFHKMNVKNDSKDLKNYHKSGAEFGTPSTLIQIS